MTTSYKNHPTKGLLSSYKLGTKIKTGKNGEEVNEGCSGSAQGPKLAREKPKIGQQLTVTRELAAGCSVRERREGRLLVLPWRREVNLLVFFLWAV